MRFLRAAYLFACIAMLIVALPFIFVAELLIDCWRRAK